MRPGDEGLKSEALQTALKEALAGNYTRLEDLLSRHGDIVRPKPNLALAAAFGAEMQSVAGDPRRLLTRFGDEDAAPDDPRAFLPIAAAHGWAGRIRAGRDVEPAWAALGALAADERSPVRVGALDALMLLAHREGGADALLEHAHGWLDFEDREMRYGTAALALEVLADRQVMSRISDADALTTYLSRAIEEVATAPRSAERLDARRRLLFSLPRTLAAVVATLTAGDRGREWLTEECTQAKNPDLRKVLSDTLHVLRGPSFGQSTALIEEIRAALEGSAKPPRDPSRIRPGTGRGKPSRRTR